MTPPLSVAVTFEERLFEFEIHERELTFGRAGAGRYYWMDGRRLRRGQGGPNFRSCVDLWWHAVERAGESRLPENETCLVLAECYPLVSTAKGMQDVYVDAHLHATADREYSVTMDDGARRVRSDRTYMLPDEECERLFQLARSRDVRCVAQELETLFLGDLPDDRHLPAYQDAAQAWIGNGIQVLRTEGREGLRRYTREVDTWLRKLRRRAGQPHVRRFLNIFSYECKVAFYLCYTSVWVALLQWLEQNRGPNLLGERFMGMWHYQNRASGDENGIPQDVFHGQVLALHPLSAVVLTSPIHLTVIGKWIGHENYEQLTAEGRVGECPEYWDLVATILIAAHEYNATRIRWDDARGGRVYSNSEALDAQVRDDATASAGVLFEDYAVAREIVCLKCGSNLSYLGYALVDGEDHQADVQFLCSRCRCPRTVRIGADDAET